MSEALSEREEDLVGLPEVATVDEVARYLRVNRKTVYEAVDKGELPGRRIGRLIRFRRDELLRSLKGEDRVSRSMGS